MHSSVASAVSRRERLTRFWRDRPAVRAAVIAGASTMAGLIAWFLLGAVNRAFHVPPEFELVGGGVIGGVVNTIRGLRDRESRRSALVTGLLVAVIISGIGAIAARLRPGVAHPILTGDVTVGQFVKAVLMSLFVFVSWKHRSASDNDDALRR